MISLLFGSDLAFMPIAALFLRRGMPIAAIDLFDRRQNKIIRIAQEQKKTPAPLVLLPCGTELSDLIDHQLESALRQTRHVLFDALDSATLSDAVTLVREYEQFFKRHKIVPHWWPACPLSREALLKGGIKSARVATTYVSLPIVGGHKVRVTKRKRLAIFAADGRQKQLPYDVRSDMLAAVLLRLPHEPTQELVNRLPQNLYTAFAKQRMGGERLLRSVDGAVLQTSLAEIPATRADILTALASGQAVFAWPEVATAFPKGWITSLPADSRKLVWPSAARIKATAKAVHRQYSAGQFLRSLSAMAGQEIKPPPASVKKHILPTVVMMSSNGTGLGHLTRLLAIAEAGRKEFRTVFLNYSAALQPCVRAGFPSYHLPTIEYLDLDPEEGISTQALEIRAYLNYFEAAALVYDGNILPHALQQAVAELPDCKLVWLRRGLWQKTISPLPLAQQALADLVLEPGDLAGSRDAGATRFAVNAYPPPRSFKRVPPIIRATSPYTGTQARARLGLCPKGEAVLVQLGAGTLGNTDDMLATVLRHLEPYSIEIVVAEWLIADAIRNLPPQVKIVREYPLRQYYAAFDFCISAAGYNSFHELLADGVPTLFMPNHDTQMDDQISRARYAAQQGWAGFCLPSETAQLASILANRKQLARQWQTKLKRSRLGLTGAVEASKLLQNLVA